MGNKSKHKGKYNSGSGRAPHGFKHAKSLGQNFLNDQNVIDDIVEGSEIDEQTLVIEIGPGEGALTTELIEQRKELKIELRNVNSKEYIEEQARKQLRLVDPDEILFVFPNEKDKDNAKDK